MFMNRKIRNVLLWHGIWTLKVRTKDSETMKTIWLPLLIVATIFLAGCGSSTRIYTDLDQTAAFDSYSTYNFLDFTEGNQKTITGMELERIRTAFAREIEKHGLSYSADQADVSLQITVFHRQGMRGYYYRPYGYNYMERAIAVDMYDNQTKKHVWHCAAVGELIYDAQRRAENLPDLAAEIFGNYPLALNEPGQPEDADR
jgi:hypothetical protein